MKAIDTVFRGNRFRSRLEARWAVFYAALDIPYQYEPQGFQLEPGPYLPDFYLPEQRAWVEIKPERPSERESALAGALASESGQDVFVFWGPIPEPEDETGYWRQPNMGDSAWAFFGHGGSGWDNLHQWCICRYCGRLGIEFDGRSGRLSCGHAYEKDYTGGHTRLAEAYRIARHARFEHGDRNPVVASVPFVPQTPPKAETQQQAALLPIWRGNAVQAIVGIASCQVRLSAVGGSIQLEGPPGAVTEEIRAVVREHRAELLAQLAQWGGEFPQIGFDIRAGAGARP